MVALFKKYWPAILVAVFLFLPKSSFAADWVNIGFSDSNFKTVYVDPKNNQRIFVSLVSYIDNNYVYYTENGGETWQPVWLGGSMTPCETFDISPTNTNEVWAGCATGLFHSTDGGKNYTLVERFRNSRNVKTSLSVDGTIYAYTSGTGFARSWDGVIWENLTPPTTQNPPVVFMNKYEPSSIYISSFGTGNYGLYKSLDHGTSWFLLSKQVPISNGIGQMVFFSNGKMCASTTYGIGCSTDNGFTWSSFVSPNLDRPHEFQHSYRLVQNPDDENNILVLAGTWDGEDMKLYTYTADTTIPTVISLDFSASLMRISQGVTYLSSPSYIKGLWRNDGIAVMPEYLKKHPVIIVPGILGSWYWPFTNKWELDPLKHTYDYLYNSFIAAGFTPEVELFKFPYQWRSDNRETAYLLKEKIDEVKAKSGANKVDIVAHSMGGIVTRIYAQSDAYQSDINQIVFVGTPQDGSTSSYPMWEAGDMSLIDSALRVPLYILLKEESLQSGYIVDGILKYIRNNVPSISQLLPVYSYLDGSIYPENYPRNELLETLNSGESVIQQRGIKVTNIVGSGVETPSDLNVFNGEFGIYWPHGKPSSYYYSDGDGTVLLSSQLGVSGNTVIKNGIRHINLPSQAMNEIMKALGIKYSDTEVINIINKYLFIAAYSPVDFYVLAPDGKRIGFNKDGAEFNEIEGAFYTGNASETEFLTIPNPLPGEYKVVTYGTGTGSYEIEATYADDEKDTAITSSYTGETVLEKETNILVELSSDGSAIEAKVDDKVAPVTTASVESTEINGYYNADTKVILSATDDESGVKKTEYSLDGVIWQDYSDPIVLDNDGEITLSYRSVDKSDNVESTQTLIVRIDKTTPVISLSLNKTRFTHWDTLKLSCKASDSYSGINEFVVSMDGETIDCSKSVNLFDKNIGSHKIEYRATDMAGNIMIGEKTYQLIVNYESTSRDIIWLYENKHFKSTSDAINVLASVDISYLLDILGMKKKAIDSLNQTQSLLDKLVLKKKISTYGYDMITRDIKYLLEGK